MCVIDQAAKLNELIAREELKYRKPILKPTGACWFCQEPLPNGQVFCHPMPGDGGCQDDYEKLQLSKVRSGK